MEKYLIGIVGSRNTGKTTVTMNLTESFSKEGYKVGIIKFSHHKFDLDPNHKDSALLRRSKAAIIISSTPYETVIYQSIPKRGTVQSLLKCVPDDINIIFCESYPSYFPKIPLIFVCDSIDDYYKTKERFNDQEPLFITGILSNQFDQALESIKILSNLKPSHLKEARELILKKMKN